MNEEFGFSLHRRGTHRLAGRTVLQIVASLDQADADRAAIDVAGALADAGARPLVAAPSGRLVSELQAKGGVWIDFPSHTKNPLLMMFNARRLKALIAREQVDLVHARSRPAGWVAYSATRAAKTPLVTSLHQITAGQSIVKQRYNSVMTKGDVVVAGSKFAAATITSLYPGAAGRITLIRPGVDLKPFSPAAIHPARVQSLRATWQIAPDERIVLLIGPPGVWTGHKVAIEAVKLLQDNGIDDLKLVFIGDAKGGKGASGKEIDQAIKASGFSDRVRRVESCADMAAALLAAAVLLVPSIEPGGFGRVAVEAQALGIPVVVSDLGAVPETVLAPPETEAAKRTGWRVSPRDAGLLAVAMREALSLGASGRDALAVRARKQVEARFTIDRMARETLQAYADLLERHVAPA
jgi:glycosyltransferase involved in cell wall biosynthesis